MKLDPRQKCARGLKQIGADILSRSGVCSLDDSARHVHSQPRRLRGGRC